MSRVHALVIALGMAVAVPALSSAQSPLVGTWQSQADDTPLSASYQEAVWGKNAKEVRTVTMVVRAKSEATLTVTRRVVDGRGRTVPGSTSVEEAQLQLGDAAQSNGVRTDLAVTVRQAERRYPGEPKSTWPLENLKVTVTTFPGERGRVEVRVDYPEGRGSFWESLRRQARRATT